MGVQRVFYVTQEELVVWAVRRGAVREVARFTNTDEGIREFASFLGDAQDQPARVLVDVIEEEFAGGTIPSLPRRDRIALLDRRLARKYSRTPFRLAQVHGRAAAADGEQQVVYCAVSNDQLLNPWLEAMKSARVPLSGIASVPLLAHRILSKVVKPNGNVLLLSQHQRDRLRLSYLRDGKLMSARLSQVPRVDADEHSKRVLAEVKKSRRYLERARFLRPDERVRACFVVDEDIAERIGSGNRSAETQFVSPQQLAQSLGMRDVPPADRLEMIYVFVTARMSIGHGYASVESTRDFRLHRLRQAAVGLLAAGTVASAAATGVNASTSAELRHAVSTMRQQTEQMQQTFRREHATFTESQAESHEMKAAVDAADFILANRVPAQFVLRELGQVFSEYPQLEIAELEWRVGDGSQPEATRQRSERVELRAASELTVEIYGLIAPYDRDLRNAFATIDGLAAALRDRTAFDSVTVTEYPVDARPASTVSGELVGNSSTEPAPFRLSLRMLPGAEGDVDDDA